MTSQSEGTRRNCPLCDQSTSRPWLGVPDLQAEPANPRTYQLYRCEGCDYGFVDPRPTPEEVRGFYPDDYYTHGPAPGPTAGSRLAFLDRVLRHLAWRCDRGAAWTGVLGRTCTGAARVCDVGSGSGDLLIQMREAGADVVGVEIDEKAREFARGRGLRVLAGTAEQLPPELEPGTFDVVTMSHVLEHCIDPIAGIANVAGLLRPGGHLIAEVPNNECLGLKRSGPAWRWLDVPRHLNFFTRRSLAEICRRTGLTVETVEYVGYTRQFEPAWAADEIELSRAQARADGNRKPDPRIGTTLSRWSLLLATAAASEPVKYDSVRILARRPAGS